MAISKEQAEKAIKTLLEYIGEDTSREGLVNTPLRVIKYYSEYLSGYKEDPKNVLSSTFKDTSEPNDIILLKNIDFESMCEHHMAPVIGRAHIAYIPTDCVVGISKLARVVDILSKRLQLQERLTSQIANVIDEVLKPKGVAVIISAKHFCMTVRGVRKKDSEMETKAFRGVFKDNEDMVRRLDSMIK